jgi:hypothetical protein
VRFRVRLLAVWVPLVFTAPADDRPYEPPYSGVVRYEAQHAQGEGVWTTATLYSAAAPESSRVEPGAPGTIERLYVSQSASVAFRLAGGSQYRLRAVDAGGNASPWSNVLVVQVGCPDTLWARVRLARDPELRLGIGVLQDGVHPWKHATGLVAWALPVDDPDSSRVVIWHQEQVQRWFLPWICATGGYWGLRGTNQPCSDTIGVLTPTTHAPGSPTR